MSIAINNDQQYFVTDEILKIFLGMDLVFWFTNENISDHVLQD
jgi:hypothetical protein